MSGERIGDEAGLDVEFVLAWIDRRFTPDERAVDRKPPFEIFLDFVFVPARVTLAIWGSMTAWLKLDDTSQ